MTGKYWNCELCLLPRGTCPLGACLAELDDAYQLALERDDSDDTSIVRSGDFIISVERESGQYPSDIGSCEPYVTVVLQEA